MKKNFFFFFTFFSLQFSSHCDDFFYLKKSKPQELSWTCGLHSAAHMLSGFNCDVNVDELIAKTEELKLKALDLKMLGYSFEIGPAPHHLAALMVQMSGISFLSRQLHGPSDYSEIKKELSYKRPVIVLLQVGNTELKNSKLLKTAIPLGLLYPHMLSLLANIFISSLSISDMPSLKPILEDSKFLIQNFGALLDKGFPELHYVTLVGFNDEKKLFYFLDTDAKYYSISYENFSKQFNFSTDDNPIIDRIFSATQTLPRTIISFDDNSIKVATL
jgi:hypothetical protein